MSYSKNFVQVVDPVINFDNANKKIFAVFKGGNEITYQSFDAVSVSQNSIKFNNINPPLSDTVVDRDHVLLEITYQIDFTGNAPAGIALLQSGYDSLRSYPNARMTESIKTHINSTTLTMDTRKVIDPILRYHNDCNSREYFYSLTPSQVDQSQSYDDLIGTIRNPLSYYGDSPDCSVEGRGSFSYNSYTNNISTGILNDTTAQINVTVTEPLFLSPFGFKNNIYKSMGLVGIETLTMTLNLLSEKYLIWCHSNAGGVTITDDNINVQILGARLYFKYITPPLSFNIPRIIPYNFQTLDFLPSSPNIAPIPPGGLLNKYRINPINLGVIPRRMYIYVSRRDDEKTSSSTDTFFSIEDISVFLGNSAANLGNASKKQLYDISRKNGCNMSYNQWSGGPTSFFNGSSLKDISTVGSVLALDFGEDIPLPGDLAPSVIDRLTFYFTISAKNIHPTESITPDVNIVAVYEGIFTVGNSKSFEQIGYLNRNDVIISNSAPRIRYNRIKRMNGYGNFFEDVSHFFKETVPRTARKFANFAKKDLLPIAKQIAPLVLPLLGLGEGGTCVGGKKRGRPKKNNGGILVGGASMPRSQLRNRILDF